MALLGAVFAAGWCFGRARGINEGWLARYFEEIARDKARRDAQGKFKSPKATT